MLEANRNENMRNLIIGGDWGKNPRASGYIKKLASYLCIGNNDFFNGGTFEELKILVNKSQNYDIIYWFPNVSNKKEKLLPIIKQKNPKCILISSKNNINGKYTIMSLIARALQVKSNLILEFIRRDNKIVGSIFDPLGNCFANREDNVEIFANILRKRVMKLKSFTRVNSVSIGDNIVCKDDNSEFYKYIKNYADVFHKLIHAAFQDRFLGNVSFRCERGFPSFRSKNCFYVSQRNMDKRFIGPDKFVAVNSELNNGMIEYYGNNKPSVDAPIHQILYSRYTNINYMLHSHVYIEDALFTKNPISCGAIDEVFEIEKIIDYDTVFSIINLLGHGSLIMSSTASKFKNIPYVARQFPEIM